MPAEKSMAVEGVPVAAPGKLAQRARAVRTKLLRRAQYALFKDDPEFAAGMHSFATEPHAGRTLVDYLFATAGDVPTPEAVCARLRWGGQFIFVSPRAQEAAEAARRFDGRWGFVLERGPATFAIRPFGLPLPLLTRRVHYVVVRKTLLVPPGQNSERFTYHLELLRNPRFGPGYVVMKQVPTLDRVLARLRGKFPDASLDLLRKRARKFVDKIFPVFLTREAAMLKILQDKLPPEYKKHVPRMLAIERDGHGFVRTLYLTWLRNGLGMRGRSPWVAGEERRPMSQLEFALQAADLLRAIHDVAGIIHLDLRLDNFVVTPEGVGFVDFGSAVKVGEELHESTLLSTLFQEMMRTSQIQRMLGQMQDSGEVTSQEIRNGYHRIDKAVDFFYLAVQINAPQSNPDFRDLVSYDAESPEAERIAALTEEILRPRDAEAAGFKSAGDILEGLRRIQAK